MLNKKRSSIAAVLSIAVTAAVLLATGWVIANRQFVLDQVNVWQYEPTEQIAAITERSGMSDQGKFHFYASLPSVATSAEFNTHCTRQEPGSAILGCYAAQRIYVYDVPGTELDGVEEVTAAHEMLHAVWERMDDDKKRTISKLLEAAFARIDDPSLNERMAYYERTQPGERENELHSILATEYRDLGAELEAHYAKYFTDRNIIVQLHDNYQAVFDELQAQSEALAAAMKLLKTSIDTKSAQYNAEAAAISAEAEALRNSADSVDRTSASEVNAYNAKRQALLDRIEALDALRADINAETATYNDKVNQYNKLIVSTNNLNKSLDSTLAPAPSL
jgi:hypothetical protein